MYAKYQATADTNIRTGRMNGEEQNKQKRRAAEERTKKIIKRDDASCNLSIYVPSELCQADKRIEVDFVYSVDTINVNVIFNILSKSLI